MSALLAEPPAAESSDVEQQNAVEAVELMRNYGISALFVDIGKIWLADPIGMINVTEDQREKLLAFHAKDRSFKDPVTAVLAAGEAAGLRRKGEGPDAKAQSDRGSRRRLNGGRRKRPAPVAI